MLNRLQGVVIAGITPDQFIQKPPVKWELRLHGRDWERNTAPLPRMGNRGGRTEVLRQPNIVSRAGPPCGPGSFPCRIEFAAWRPSSCLGALHALAPDQSVRLRIGK